MAHKKGHKETWWERFKKGLKEIKILNKKIEEMIEDLI